MEAMWHKDLHHPQLAVLEIVVTMVIVEEANPIRLCTCCSNWGAHFMCYHGR